MTYLVLKTFIGVVLSPLSGDSDASLAKRCWLRNLSYRLPKSAQNDPWIGFKVLFRLLSKPKPIPFRILNRTNRLAIYDGTFKFYELETEYVKQLETPVGYFYSKEEMGYLDWRRVLSSTSLFFIGCLVGFICMVRKRQRGNLALIVRELAEAINFGWHLKMHEISRLYDFVPYEKDSNLLHLILRKLEVEHVKLVSPGPIALHNRVLLADVLCVNTPYHLEEANHFRETIRVESIQQWPPEFAFSYLERYANSKLKEAEHKIGFYSHGSWIRKMEGHAKSRLNIGQEEEDLLKLLGRHEDSNMPVSPAVIFCHPREKKKEYEELARKHYSDRMGGEMFVFAPFEMSTAEQFDTVDIGLSAYSTIIYERLFCGFKTLIYTPTWGDNAASFPLPNSSISNICFRNKSELEALIRKNSNLSNREFFKMNKLDGYPYWDYTALNK